ncbi:unnamed protein product [Protopolystoma xenopodis]|uniref:Uncharacterized protein n=1 Tax=Protopolystoma xenopodis TaxID=117903 RepID=A0A3S5B1B9_9PLAT|nr:unnamed protein product [Protopolystoma xenopodis]
MFLETLSVSVFHWIHEQILSYRETLFADRRGGGSNFRAIQASRRLALAVAAYREFLTCLGKMAVGSLDEKDNDGTLEDRREERLRLQKQAADTIMDFGVGTYSSVFRFAELHIISSFHLHCQK